MNTPQIATPHTATSHTATPQTAPVDTALYEILEVSPHADEAEIKYAYFRIARKWHPDTSTEALAEEKFKEVNQAYHILKDRQRRQLYDQSGKHSVLEQHGKIIDPRDLFRSLFGGDNFDQVFGSIDEFSFFIMPDFVGKPAPETPAGTDPLQAKISALTDPNFLTDEEKKRKMDEMEEKQRKKIHRLSLKLSTTLQPWLLGHHEEFESKALKEAEELAICPGGGGLLIHVGYLYEQEAKQHLNRYMGLQSFISEVQEKAHILKEAISLIGSVIQVQKTEGKLEQDITNEELNTKLVTQSLWTLWKIGKLEIESTIRKVCESTLEDPTMVIDTRRQKAEGLEKLGQIYTKVGNEILTMEKEELQKRLEASKHLHHPQSH